MPWFQYFFFLYLNLKQKPLLLSIPHNKLPCLKPSDVDVIELHDCFSANELINYEALGLCPLGKAGEMIDNGDNTYGGKYVVNPSGGLISKVSRFYKHNYLKKNMPCLRTISNVLSSVHFVIKQNCLKTSHKTRFSWDPFALSQSNQKTSFFASHFLISINSVLLFWLQDNGLIAQVVKEESCKQEVMGSNLIIYFSSISKLIQKSGWHKFTRTFLIVNSL